MPAERGRRGIAFRIWQRSSAFAIGAGELASRGQLGRALQAIEISETCRTFVTERYLPRLDGFERAATWHLLLHNRLRVLTTVAGFGAPVLIGVQLASSPSTISWVAFGLTLTTATCLGIDSAFRLADRWRHNRQTAESLKREGWLFLTLSGPYEGVARERAAHRFHERVERLVASHLDVLLEDLSREGVPDSP